MASLLRLERFGGCLGAHWRDCLALKDRDSPRVLVIRGVHDVRVLLL